MKVLVFGKNGQVGKELNKYSQVIAFTKDEADFIHKDKCLNIINEINPSVVINTVAKTNLDFCEKDRDNTEIVNTLTPIEIALKCKNKNIPFIHISTDYVFDGKKTSPYYEDDQTNPVNYYGLTKSNAEKGIIKLNSNSIILRTSWVFSNSKSNFLSKIIKQIKNNKEVKVVGDQVGSPTSAIDLAKTCIYLSQLMKERKQTSSIYHYSGYPETSFYDYAKEIKKYLLNKTKIIKIKSSDYPQIAIRPLYTYLNCDLIKNDFGIKRPDWKKSLKEVLKSNQ